jgi:cytochrome oxidase Cu insertion factor (SCO1/SenC/PrrC family)
MKRQTAVRVAAALFVLFVLPAITFLFLWKGERLRSQRKVPPFELTSADGTVFQSNALSGKVCVAEFTFSDCRSIVCLKLDSVMHALYSRFGGGDGFAMITITVNPAVDDPARLLQFASSREATWPHLTGAEDKVRNLILGGFYAKGDAKQGVAFSSRADPELCVTDENGFIKGYFNVLDKEETILLVKTVEELLND